MPGIDLAYVVTKSCFIDVWDYAKSTERHEKASTDNPDDFLFEPPGMCVEGIRVRSAPAGYRHRDNAPWVFVNLTGIDAPKTNVARSDIEQTQELEQTLLRIYTLIGQHILNEFNRLLEKKTGIVDAAKEADFIRSIGLEHGVLSDRTMFEEAMATLSVIALEDENVCRAVKKKELELMEKVWTVDSKLVLSLETICGTLGIDIPTEKIVEKLGKHIEPAIPLPRVLGSSKDPFSQKEITKILIYPEERTHRIDICWEKVRPGRWNKLPKNIVENLRQYSREQAHSFWFTRDTDIASGCPDYDLILWRGLGLILPSSGIPDLLAAFDMNDTCGRWIALLLNYGAIPTDQLRILKEQLVDAVGKDSDELLNRLVLPYERRFGDYRVRERGHSNLGNW